MYSSNIHYNMAGVAWAIVIFTMHEAWSIMHWLAQSKEIWESKPLLFRYSHISHSQWKNCEIIIDINFFKSSNQATQLFSKALSYKLKIIGIGNITNL